MEEKVVMVDTVMLARSLFGSSMAFHIIFATLGVGIPVMIVSLYVIFSVIFKGCT